jgi:hypothetical protein
MGLVKGLATRLGTGRAQRVQFDALLAEVTSLRISQEQTQLVMREFLAAVHRVDGLSVNASVVEFSPTAHSPTVGDVLMNLDEEIEALGSRVAAPAIAPSTRPSVVPAGQHGGSILEGLDEEIHHLRAAGHYERSDG